MTPFEICIVFLIIYGKNVASNLLGVNAIWNKTNNLNISPEKLECVLNVVHQEVDCQDFFTVLHQSNYGDRILEELSADNCYSFIVRTPKSQKWLLRSEAYIILVKNINDFIQSIDKLSKDFGWNARAKFFIIIPRFENLQYLNFFRILARLNMYHVHVITTEPTAEIYVYTYNPFDEERCGLVDEHAIKKNPCKGFIDNELSETEIENKIRNCPITVLAIENPPNVIFKTNEKYIHHGFTSMGIEQYMLNNIAKIENYSFHQIDLGFSYRTIIIKNITDECTSSFLLRHLSKHPLGISIGGYVVMKKRSDCLDFIWGYCYSNLKIYTGVFGTDHSRIVYQAFGTTTWALIAISFCLVTLLSSKIYKMSVGKINNKYLALKIWAYLNSHPDKELIKIRKLRVIIVTWIWFSFFIVNFYNTAFYTLLTAPDNRGIIVKPEQLFSSPLKPCISKNIRIFFKQNFNVTLLSIDNDECLNENSALNAVTENIELYTLVNEPTHYKRENKYLDKFGLPKLERWLFGTGDFPFTIVANRGFLLLNKFQRYAWYHFESGLLLKHTLDLNHHYTKFSEFVPFTLTEFSIHFSILLVGYIISFIVYVIEINKKKITYVHN